MEWARKSDVGKGKKDPMKEIRDMEFTDFKIDGDTATAKAGKKTIHFSLIDGKWYVDLLGGKKRTR